MSDPTPVVATLRRPRARWYWLALVSVLLGFGIAGGMLWRMYGNVLDMQRLLAPGERDLSLAAGDHVGFLEQHSIVDGIAYSSDRFTGSCSLVDAGSHEPIKLGSVTTNTSYQLGSYAGKAEFSFTIPHDGTYHLTCKGDGPPTVIAIGEGLGTAIVIAVVAGFGGIGLGIFVALLIRRRRRKSLTAAAPLPTATARPT